MKPLCIKALINLDNVFCYFSDNSHVLTMVCTYSVIEPCFMNAILFIHDGVMFFPFSFLNIGIICLWSYSCRGLKWWSVEEQFQLDSDQTENHDNKTLVIIKWTLKWPAAILVRLLVCAVNWVN